MDKNKESTIRIKEKATSLELTRYVHFCTHSWFNYTGSLKDNVPIKTKSFYKIAWRTLWSDIKNFFKNPFEYAPAIAYSLLAFWFIFQKKHAEAMQFAMIGSITLGTPQSTMSAGDPSVSLTIASGDILIAAIGIHQGNVNGVTWNGGAMTQGSNAATAFNERAELWYHLTPTTGTLSCLFDGTIGTGRFICAIAVAGVKTTGQPNQTGAGATGSDSSIESTSITPSTDGALIIDSVYTEATLNSAGSNQTIQANIQGASYENGGCSTYIQPTAAAQSHTWALSSGQRWASAVMAFEQAGGATVTPKQLPSLGVGS